MLHHGLPFTKKASPKLVEKTSAITDSTQNKNQNEYNINQDKEKVCANIKSLTSGNKKTPSVVTDSKRKKVQKKDIYTDECHDGVFDMLIRTRKVSALMGLSFKQSLQIPFSSFKTLSVLFLLKKKSVRWHFKVHENVNCISHYT